MDVSKITFKEFGADQKPSILNELFKVRFGSNYLYYQTEDRKDIQEVLILLILKNIEYLINITDHSKGSEDLLFEEDFDSKFG